MRLRRGRKATADQPGWQGPGAADRFERAQNWLDERLGTTSFARMALRKVLPDHWSFLLGEIALQLDHAPVVRGQGRPAHAADPPLGHAGAGGRDRGAPVPGSSSPGRSEGRGS